ncbi:putative NAD P H-dependent FMN reductase [Streptomyces clavuligerus]|uniref:Putative NAD P H-dependent FMN reductase n=2 Tax=Streptomyces clavuligerus TaxID=1901 RepID=E2PVF2_STRCL|nr:putative NAD P H-dependent FMN reductase [Streptomyces clavuligerus]
MSMSTFTNPDTITGGAGGVSAGGTGGGGTFTLVAVSAGLSVPSSTRLLADRLAEAVRGPLAERGTEVEVKVVELRELAVPIANHLVTGFPPPQLDEAIRAVTEADGLIAVTPVFTASYSGLFKSFFDLIDPDALSGKPVLIGATGGTARHSLVLEHALRPLFAYLRAVVVPTAVYAASEDWGGSGDPLTDTLPVRIERAGAQLARLMETGTAERRASDGVPVLSFPV